MNSKALLPAGTVTHNPELLPMPDEPSHELDVSGVSDTPPSVPPERLASLLGVLSVVIPALVYQGLKLTLSLTGSPVPPGFEV